MNTKVNTIRAFNKYCIGCKKENSDVMISFASDDSINYEYTDLFLTQAQAKLLIEDLSKAYAINMKEYE